MQSRKAGLAVAGLAVAAAIVLFVVLRDDGSGSGTPTATTPTAEAPGGNGPAPERDGGQGQPSEPDVATIVVRGGRPAGGVQELTFEKGGRIRFVVESDVADEVHLHGYDIAKPVSAGGEVEFDLPASLEGVFEVELEERVVPLAEVTVNP
jgi:hypothetical protein